MLLQNNSDSTLLDWVIDHCYDSKPICAQLCFHALCNTLASKYERSVVVGGGGGFLLSFILNLVSIHLFPIAL